MTEQTEHEKRKQSECILGFDAIMVPGGKRGVIKAVVKMTGKLRTIVIPSLMGMHFVIEDITVAGKSAFREGGPPVPAIVFSESSAGSVILKLDANEGDEIAFMVLNNSEEEEKFAASMIWDVGKGISDKELAGIPPRKESMVLITKGTVQPKETGRFSMTFEETMRLVRLILISPDLQHLRVTNIEVDGEEQLLGSIGPEGVGLPAVLYAVSSFPPRFNLGKGTEYAVVFDNDSDGEVGVEVLFVLD